jgi:hypothetical protein
MYNAVRLNAVHVLLLVAHVVPVQHHAVHVVRVQHHAVPVQRHVARVQHLAVRVQHAGHVRLPPEQYKIKKPFRVATRRGFLCLKSTQITAQKINIMKV